MITSPGVSPNYSAKPQVRHQPNSQSNKHVKFSGLAGDRLDRAADFINDCCLVGAAAVMSPFRGIHNAVKLPQLRKFKNVVNEGTIAQHFPNTPAGNKALHERMRWLVASGDVELVRSALVQDRVKALDLNTGDHIGPGKKSALVKAITHIENPKTQTRMLIALMTHPKFDPNARYAGLGFVESGTLLEKAVDTNNADLAEAILQNEELEIDTVQKARDLASAMGGKAKGVTPLLKRWLMTHVSLLDVLPIPQNGIYRRPV